jgi:hypothetical protein
VVAQRSAVYSLFSHLPRQFRRPHGVLQAAMSCVIAMRPALYLRHLLIQPSSLYALRRGVRRAAATSSLLRMLTSHNINLRAWTMPIFEQDDTSRTPILVDSQSTRCFLRYCAFSLSLGLAVVVLPQHRAKGQASSHPHLRAIVPPATWTTPLCVARHRRRGRSARFSFSHEPH